MFVPVSTPEEPAGAELRALRLSLNSPVVEVESLPVGPANAAIALHEASGVLRISLALRSERGRKLVFYAHDERSEAGPELLLEAALSFAEGMGFLFDDDEVETRGEAGPREGARIWLGFTGVGEPAAGAERADPAAPAASLDPPFGATLTKFRQRIDEALARRSPGARIQLLGRF
jgi:hypothetical protein